MDWYVPAVLLNVSLSVTTMSVLYIGLSSWCDTAAVPFCALVTPRVVESLFCVTLFTKNISDSTW